jgi:hypothetical protein
MLDRAKVRSESVVSFHVVAERFEKTEGSLRELIFDLNLALCEDAEHSIC